MKKVYSITTCILLLAFLLAACDQAEKVPQAPVEDDGLPRIVDLTYAFDSDTVYWVNAEEFKRETVAEGKTDKGFYYSAYNYSAAEHGGTHIDSPIHFAEGKQTTDEIPLGKLIADAVLIDVSEKALKDPDYLVTVEDFREWESKNSTIPRFNIVLIRTGYGDFYPDKEKYLGTSKRGDDAVEELKFPGLHPEAAKWLVEERKVNAVGIDTASIDRGISEKFEAHVALMTNDVPAFENVANLKDLPAKGFRVIALPMKIKGGSGGPLRIIAVIS